MGRTVRRVPLDFSWPMNKTWEGFLNDLPYGDNCPACVSPRDPNHSTGYSPKGMYEYLRWYGHMGYFDPVAEGKAHMMFTPESPPIRAFAERQIAQSPEYYGRGEAAIQRECVRMANLQNTSGANFLDQADVDALCEAGRLMDFTHNWSPREDDGAGGWTGGWQPKEPAFVPTFQQVNDWSAGPGMGHDSINQWVVLKSRCERAGVPSTCEKCGGEAVIWPSSLAKEKYEAWESTPPPAGDGWQMWETTSEGSAISPVFATPEELARYMARSSYSDGSSYATWLAMIAGDGWAPSVISIGGVGVFSGVEALNGPSDPAEVRQETNLVTNIRSGDVLDAIFSDVDQ